MLTTENEKHNRMSFPDVQIIREDKTFTRCVPTINRPLVEFAHILVAFRHIPISLVLFTHALIANSDYAQVGLNYTLNYFF